MSGGKVKASKVKVHVPPDSVPAPEGQFFVYVFDVVQKTFVSARAVETIEKAASFQRHEQERIYTEQEAEPELFDLPFISSDPDLVARAERDADYRNRLIRDLTGEARQRARRR
jgi:hypothetical protein